MSEDAPCSPCYAPASSDGTPCSPSYSPTSPSSYVPSTPKLLLEFTEEEDDKPAKRSIESPSDPVFKVPEVPKNKRRRAETTPPPPPPPAGLPPGIELHVVEDCEGYFAAEVAAALWRKHDAKKKFEHEKIVINAGPWRSYDVRWEKKTETIKPEKEGEEERVIKVLDLDFYSVARMHGYTIEKALEDMM